MVVFLDMYGLIKRLELQHQVCDAVLQFVLAPVVVVIYRPSEWLFDLKWIDEGFVRR